MTKDEAQVYLNCSSEEELEEVFESALFEMKQFFLTKPVFLKTFESKWAKLAKLNEAYLTLGGSEQVESIQSITPFESSTIVIDHFSTYHDHKNKIKRFLSTSQSSVAMKTYAMQLVELERVFTEPFSQFTDWTAEEVTIGKESDSMEVLRLLKIQHVNQVSTLKMLNENKNNLPNELLLVLKRLSLLKNYL